MAEINVKFPESQLSQTADAIALSIYNARRDLLEVLGVQLLSFAQEAYDVKSQGGVGDDGIQWKPIKVSTLLARLHRAGHLVDRDRHHTPVPKAVPVNKRQVYVQQVTKKGATKHNKELFDALSDAGLTFHNRKSGKLLKAGKRNQSGAFIGHVDKETMRNEVAVGGYMIGVDTGLQRASGTPGYKANANQIFDINDKGVTVGYGMKYSKFFARKRKLFPDILPDAWMKTLEELAGKETEAKIVQVIREKGVT